MRELKALGDAVTAGCLCHGGLREARYGIIDGTDTCMSHPHVGELTDVLYADAKRAGKLGWLPCMVALLGLGEFEYDEESGFADSAFILAMAHVTWHRIESNLRL